MSDERRRQNERLASAGDTAARVRFLRDRIRDGSLAPRMLELAAYAGDETAFEALEHRENLLTHEWQIFDYPGSEDVNQLWAPFERTDRATQVHAAFAAVARAFGAIEPIPELAPARPAIRACFARPEPASLEELHGALAACRAALGTATVAPSLFETLIAGELLEEALRERRAPVNAFLAASRALGARLCRDAAAQALASSVEDPELAAVLGSKEARRTRRPSLDPIRWALGLDRWGAVPVVRAVLAAVLHDPGHRGDLELRRVEQWLSEPSRDLADRGWETTSSDLIPLLNDMTSPAGLPAAGRTWSVVAILEQQRASMSAESLQEVMRAEIARFALAERGPIFRFAGLEVLEELGPARLGQAFRARDASGADLQILDIQSPLPEGAVRKVTDPVRALDHPGFAHLERVIFAGDHRVRGVALVLEHANGVPLPLWVAGRTEEEKLAVIEQASRALEYAHEKGLIHGRLEPASIRVDEGGARIWDLALGPLEDLDLDGDPERDPEPRLHGFYAPETLRTGRVTPSADLYGLGAIAYWLFAGSQPFEGRSPLEQAKKILLEPPPRSPFRDSVIRRALAKDPAQRYPTLSSFRSALLDG